jgi:phosphoglycolate phosphatase-like HAD superfamily hydrolase
MSSGQSPNLTSSSPAPRNSPSSPEECYVVGDAVWDLLAARRARMLSIGILSGGYGEDELARAGAFRVYRDTSELRESLDELGLLT